MGDDGVDYQEDDENWQYREEEVGVRSLETRGVSSQMRKVNNLDI